MSEVKPLDIYGFIGRLADKERISNMAEQEKSIVDTGTGIPELDSIMNAYSRASRGVHDTEWWGEEE